MAKNRDKAAETIFHNARKSPQNPYFDKHLFSRCFENEVIETNKFDNDVLTLV